jgi:hypothetical protein
MAPATTTQESTIMIAMIHISRDEYASVSQQVEAHDPDMLNAWYEAASVDSNHEMAVAMSVEDWKRIYDVAADNAHNDDAMYDIALKIEASAPDAA